MSKFIWSWGYDGTMVYVYEVYTTRFTHKHKLNKIKYFYTERFDNPQLVAEQFIERLEALQEGTKG